MRSISIQAFDKIKYSIYNGPGMMKIARADFICIKCTKFWKNTFFWKNGIYKWNGLIL